VQDDLPCLQASRLLPIPEPSGGGRLIAISVVWYRRSALCAPAAFPEAGSNLKPLQIEVGVSGGSQLVRHALHASIAAEAGCDTFQIDWKNAFNTLRRVQMLMAMKTRCPSLLPFVAWAYRQPSRLYVCRSEGAVVCSQSGVRQGDPLGVPALCPDPPRPPGEVGRNALRDTFWGRPMAALGSRRPRFLACWVPRRWQQAMRANPALLPKRYGSLA
jgi:hypothetical protein